MEQVCDMSFHMKFYLRLYAHRIKKLYLSEQDIVLHFRRITEPRKNQLKIEIKHIYKEY